MSDETVTLPPLGGIRVDYGTLMGCQDSSSYEMAMRLNRDHSGEYLLAVLGINKGVLQSAAVEASSGVMDEERSSEKARKDDTDRTAPISVRPTDTRADDATGYLFVREEVSSVFREEMQQWLDPFYTQTLRIAAGSPSDKNAPNSKRRREETVTSDPDDGDNSSSLDEVDSIPSSASSQSSDD